MLEKYIKNNLSKDYTSIWLFRAVKKKFNCDKVLYPWCYVHITPSLVFSDVIYVDSFRNTYKFYESLDVKEYIEKNKEYSEVSIYKFYQQDYINDLPEKLNSVDIIISQYWGFVGKYTKKYLKKWWVLVCNNSHWDASMASMDSDYKLVGVYNRKSDDKFTISDKNLNEYLISKKHIDNPKEVLEKSMKGFWYTKSPSGYIFEKIN